MGKILLLAMLVFAGLGLSGADLRCAQCNKPVRGKYITSKGRAYCSKKCFERTLPVCVRCKKVCRGKFFRDESGNPFCSKKCFEAALPKCAGCGEPMHRYTTYISAEGNIMLCHKCNGRAIFCFSCRRPCVGGEPVEYEEDRFSCTDCAKSAVLNSKQVAPEIEKVRDFIRRKFKYEFPHSTKVTLCDRHTIAELESSSGPGTELGLYHYESQTTTDSGGRTEVDEKCGIYILNGISLHRFREVLAHEAAHDFMQHRFPDVIDPSIREGFAEYVASLYNIEQGQAHLNARMETNPDPVYGDGYRKVKAWGTPARVLEKLAAGK